MSLYRHGQTDEQLKTIFEVIDFIMNTVDVNLPEDLENKYEQMKKLKDWLND